MPLRPILLCKFMSKIILKFLTLPSTQSILHWMKLPQMETLGPMVGVEAVMVHHHPEDLGAVETVMVHHHQTDQAVDLVTTDPVTMLLPTTIGQVTMLLPTTTGLVIMLLPATTGLVTMLLPTTIGLVTMLLPTTTGPITMLLPTITI